MGLSKPLIVNTTTESVDLSALETAIADVKTSADNAWTYAVQANAAATEAKTNAADAKTQATNAATYAGNVNTRLTATRAGYLDKLNTGVPVGINGAIGFTGTSLAMTNTSTTVGTWNGSGRARVAFASNVYANDASGTFTAIVDGSTMALTAIAHLAPVNLYSASGLERNLRIFEVEFEKSFSLKCHSTTENTCFVNIELK